MSKSRPQRYVQRYVESAMMEFLDFIKHIRGEKS